MPLCSVGTCQKDARCNGVCEMHYKRFQKYGNYDGGSATHAPPHERVWRFVEKRGPDECWPWKGAKTQYGYGQFKITNRPVKYGVAHRFIFECINGDVGDNRVVRHTCDNPPCCNPNHLLKGTQADNMADMVARSRHVRKVHGGTKNPNSILSEDDVRAIRASKDSHQHVADSYGVSKGAVAAIRSRRTWNHVT